MDEDPIASRTLVLIDPSSPDGEGGISMLTHDDEAVTLLLTIEGRSATSLRDFAEAEDIDVSMAGLIYLEQVARRIGIPTDDIETISTIGCDAVSEILHVLRHRPVIRVIVPASMPGFEGGGLAMLVQSCPVPVLVAPRADTSSFALLSASQL